jgi:hypothetical protein
MVPVTTIMVYYRVVTSESSGLEDLNWLVRGSFLGSKPSGECGCNVTPPVCVHGLHRDNFAFHLRIGEMGLQIS